MRRRWMRGAAVGIALVLVAAPAASATGSTATTTATTATIGSGGWVPAPSSPFDREAGVLCDFPVHGEPIVDEVRKRTLVANPDGTPRSELWVGRLVIRVTNTATGASVDSDASGSAVITYGADGSQFWAVAGPTQIGFRAGGGNLPRGLYRLDGVYTLAFDAAGTKTYTPILHATQDNICTHID